MPNLPVCIFVGYLAVLVAIGFISKRYTKGMEGFALGDRGMGPWLTAMSYESTAYSGWLMLGLPGRAFKFGLAAFWVGISCVLGDALNWILVSRRLREETAKIRSLTIPEYLERRFYKPNGYAIQCAATAAITLFMLIYLWAQFVAAGRTIMTMLHWEYRTAAIVSSAIIVLYTLQGGYRAVVWTDCVQALMMVSALIVLPIACFMHIGGWHALIAAMEQASQEAAATPGLAEKSSHLGSWFAGLTGMTLFSFLFEDAGVGLGYIGQPHICARFMGIRDSRALRPAFVMSIMFAALVCSGAVMVGLIAHGWYRFADTTPQLNATAEAHSAEFSRIPINLSNQEQELILPKLTLLIMPSWLAGLVVSAIMAAIMSTSSGFLLSMTSSLAEDVYHRLIQPEASGKHLVLASRLITFGLGLTALVLTFMTDPNDPKSTVYSLVLYGWGGLAGAFSAPVTMALLYPRMTRAGCLAGIIVGASSVIIWRQTPILVNSLNEIIPSIAASALTIVLVSSFTKQHSPEPTTEALAHG